MQDQELKVSVVEFGDRPVYQLQWIDPNTGRKKTRTSGVRITGRKKERQDAERAAATLEASLQENYHANFRQISWEAFRDRYEREVVPSLAAKTGDKIKAVFNSIEKHLNPMRLSHVGEARIAFYAAALRDDKKSEATIKGYLSHLKAALRWAKRMKLISQAPEIQMPSRATERSKGRPITGEEFDRMIAAIPDIVGEKVKKPWERFLRGLWYSGLRLGEALNLHWERDDMIRVELEGKRPMLHIPAALDKGNRDGYSP